ncbi:MAG: L-2-amino-thiazoline-4-carboxylic acid hydrolase [Dehalococcoidia bacterium]|nr:L-2-amino-thiazoline-4-carboxylic acid hydrolase [Dehalococcoidia bacterium]
MDDLEREKKQGFDWDYLADVLDRKAELGDRYQLPGFGLGAALFAYVAKAIINEIGPEKGEALLRQAIEDFGRARGRRIAATVKDLGQPLTIKSWLIYSDIDSGNFDPHPDLDNNDLVVKAGECTFWNTAREFGMGDYAKIYCKYVDYAILEGYNPDAKLLLHDRHHVGQEDHCLFRYIMKEANKEKL